MSKKIFHPAIFHGIQPHSSRKMCWGGVGVEDRQKEAEPLINQGFCGRSVIIGFWKSKKNQRFHSSKQEVSIVNALIFCRHIICGQGFSIHKKRHERLALFCLRRNGWIQTHDGRRTKMSAVRMKDYRFPTTCREVEKTMSDKKVRCPARCCTDRILNFSPSWAEVDFIPSWDEVKNDLPSQKNPGKSTGLQLRAKLARSSLRPNLGRSGSYKKSSWKIRAKLAQISSAGKCLRERKSLWQSLEYRRSITIPSCPIIIC